MTISTLQGKDALDVTSQAARLIAREIEKDLQERGTCVVGIAGGRSIPAVLSAITPLVKAMRGEVHIVWLDERVPSEKNYVEALPILHAMRTTTLHVFPHPLKTTMRDDILKEGTRALATLARVRGEARLDLVLASAGEDGHVASLFPRQAALKVRGRAYTIVEGAPKSPATRITVTSELLLTARWGMLLFMGGEKRIAYTHFLDTSIPTKDCPAKLLLGLPTLVVATALGR